MGGTGQTLTGRRRDGSEIPVEIALSPIRTNAGMRYLASIRDISETQRARQVLVRARYDSLVVRVGQMVMSSTDEDTAIARLPNELATALDVDAVAVVAAHAPQTRLQLRAGSGLDDALSLTLPPLLGPDHSGARSADATHHRRLRARARSAPRSPGSMPASAAA